MEHTIQDITSLLLSRLPEQSDAIRIDELRKNDIPDFLVERVKVELYRNLAESIIPPQTDWADMESERVKQSWNAFVNAIKAEAQLPPSFAPSVLETAVADVLEMLTQPRKVLPDVLFGSEDEIEFDTLIMRMDTVVVYRYLVNILPRYMEKKGMPSITKERGKHIISQADEKVTANYTPLNWVQLLDPLFELCSNNVDSELLRLFFEDKKLSRIAQCFDEQPSPVNRQKTIEILASFHLHRTSETEEPEDRTQATAQESSEKTSEEKVKKKKISESEDKPEEQDTPLLDRFKKKNGNEDEGKMETESDYPDSDLTKKNQSKTREPHGQAEDSNQPSLPEEDENSDEEIPIWKQFGGQEETEITEENITTISSQTEDSRDDTEFQHSFRYEKLKEHLADQQEYFKTTLFKGDTRAFHRALQILAKQNSWQEASEFIRHEIFKKNLIDIFSESAVDFTDKLQTYFKEHITDN